MDIGTLEIRFLFVTFAEAHASIENYAAKVFKTINITGLVITFTFLSITEYSDDTKELDTGVASEVRDKNDYRSLSESYRKSDFLRNDKT
ncbi:46510_t:CDS:2, partial [Gigaspora margarita]